MLNEESLKESGGFKAEANHLKGSVPSEGQDLVLRLFPAVEQKPPDAKERWDVWVLPPCC